MAELPPFGELLRAERHTAQLTQEELAERARLSPRAISDLERGVNRTARKATARLLADALGLEEPLRSRFLAAARARPSGSTEAAGGPDRIPVSPTMLLGRERDVVEAVAVLADPGTRLLTLLGPGGVGKTRLALEVLRRGAGSWGDDRVFVDLEHIRPEDDGNLVAHAIIRALGVRDVHGADPAAALVREIGDRVLLLVLDNVEQAQSAGLLVSQLLGECPRLTVLATSRRPLHLRGERRQPVPPLPSDAAGPGPGQERSPAVALFLERAAAVDPARTYGTAELQAVVEICRRLDGLPLAIELAAARSSVLDPHSILERLSDPLSLLVGGPRDASPRHRALAATLSWSHELLDDAAASVFRRTEVFAGGFTLEAAEQVCWQPDRPDVLGALTTLTDSSLLVRGAGTAGRTRFTMLQTVRDFAQELLAASGERDVVGRAHAVYVSRLVEAASGGLAAAGESRSLALLDEEQLNIVAALRQATAAADADLALGLAGRMWRYWEIRGRLGEGRYWLEQALGLPGGSSQLRALAWRGAGNLARDQGALEEADHAHAESLALCRADGDREGEARCANNLGNVALDRGNPQTACDWYRRALDLAGEIGDDLLVALTTHNLGLAARTTGDHGQAAALLERSLRDFQRLGNDREVARCHESLARLAAVLGRPQKAMGHHVEALRLRHRLGDLAGLARSLEGAVGPLTDLGDPRRAADLLASARQLRVQIGEAYTADERAEDARNLRRLAEVLGEDLLRQALDGGAGPAVDRVLDLLETGAAAGSGWSSSAT
jgi:predicted ATPase/DNA-binding XRE family transcriptional regulator